jgi:DNA-binding MarR family transcriptional regulator
MQTLQERKKPPAGRREPGHLAPELASHWEELVRFVADRRLRSAILSGVAAELTPAQVGALTALDRGEMRMGDLAVQLGLAESSVTRLVDRLVALGLVERRSSSADRRSVVARLSEEGRRAVGQIRAERAELLREILSGLAEGEREEFVRLFGRVAEELRRRRVGGRRP